MKLYFALLLLIGCSFPCLSQTPAKKKVVPSPAKDCKAEQAEAWIKGWGAGLERGTELGTAEGMRNGLAPFSVQLSDKDKRIKMKVDIEDELPGAGSYRLAAAEIVRTHFSNQVVIDPGASLFLYVTGSNVTPRAGYEVHSLHVDIRVYTSHPFLQGDGVLRSPHGDFVFANAGTTLAGYQERERTQAVREMVYKVLSDFLTKWQEAASRD